MKILFYRYGNICEPDIIEQFTTLGLEIETEEAEITNKRLNGAERVKLLSNHLEKGGFLFVFSINFFPNVSDVCNIYGVPYVCWTVDSPIVELYSKSIENPVNHIFVFDRAQYEELKQYISAVYYLPLATNADRWDRVNANITAGDRQRFSADISFVGSLYTDNDPLKDINMSEYLRGFLAGLYGMQREVEGVNLIEQALTNQVKEELKRLLPTYFEGFGETVKPVDGYVAAHSLIGMHFSSLQRLKYLRALGEHFDVKLFTRSSADGLKDLQRIKICGGVQTLTEMPKVFNLSKINLNMTIYPIEKGLPLRIWDVLGAGGFLLTNFREELLEYFEPGVELDYFSDENELVDKCEFYLKHDDVRRQIAASGYERVKDFHTYANRMPGIFKNILE